MGLKKEEEKKTELKDKWGYHACTMDRNLLKSTSQLSAKKENRTIWMFWKPRIFLDSLESLREPSGK